MENIHRRPEARDKNFAVAQMQRFIDDGKRKAASAIEQVMTQVPVDRVVKAGAMSFENDLDDEEIKIVFPFAPTPHHDGEATSGDFARLMNANAGTGVRSDILAGDVQSEAIRLGLHSNAIQQVAGRLDIPKKYVDDLAANSDWGRELLAQNLNTLIERRFADRPHRFLTRSVDGQVRGFLSDSYRRIDSRPMLDAIIDACDKNGAIICDGFAGETKVHVKAILPEVIEPIPGEYVVFGFGWSNSDFGRGATELYSFIERLVCLNGMHLAVEMRKVHLGSRLADNIEYSDRTYQLDTEAMAAVVKDTTKHLLGKGRIDELAKQMRSAHDNEIDPQNAVAGLRRAMNKGEIEETVRAFNSPDVVNLPPGNSTWRLSNAISWIANNTDDAERAQELRDIAGDVIKKVA